MVKASTIKAVYKCLLRDARELQRTPHFNFRSALQVEQWGTGNYVEPPAAATTEPQKDTPPLLRSLDQFRELQSRRITQPSPSVDVVEAVRASFRENRALQDPKIISTKLDEAIDALRELSNQLLLAKCSSVTVTDGVRIEATSQYVENHSDPEEQTYRFTYRVTITNENKDSFVQITGRQYTFESEKGQRIALPKHSPGIVGNKPELAPGQTFEYASGVDIDAPRGSVTGRLHAVRKKPAQANDKDQDDELQFFDAFVSKFALLAPAAERRR